MPFPRVDFPWQGKLINWPNHAQHTSGAKTQAFSDRFVSSGRNTRSFVCVCENYRKTFTTIANTSMDSIRVGVLGNRLRHCSN